MNGLVIESMAEETSSLDPTSAPLLNMDAVKVIVQRDGEGRFNDERIKALQIIIGLVTRELPLVELTCDC